MTRKTSTPATPPDLALDNDSVGLLEPVPAGVHEELDRIHSRLQRDKEDLVANVARAALIGEYGPPAKAVALYRQILQRWPSAIWVWQPLHRLLRQQSIQPPPGYEPEPEGHTYAFLVGISKYKYIPSLRFADQDADLVKTFLATARGWGLQPPKNPGAQPETDDMVVLENDKATYANITEKLKTFVRGRAAGNNTLIIYIAAHGGDLCPTRKVNGTCQTAPVPYILTTDTQPEAVETLGIRMSEFRDLVTGYAPQFGRVLVYVDTCHSGDIGLIAPLAPKSAQTALANDRTGMLFATDADSNRNFDLAYEASADGKRGNGLFTYYLVRALNGRASSFEFPTFAEDLRRDVREATGNLQSPSAGRPLPPSTFRVLDRTDKPGIPASEFPVAPSRGDVRKRTHKADQIGIRQNTEDAVDALDRAQQVLVDYIRGEEAPPGRDRFENAAALFRQTLQADPDRTFTESRMLFCEARALLFRRPGQAVIAQTDLDRARELLDRSILLDPNRPYSYNALGLLFLEEQQYGDAIRAFEDATRVAPYWAYPLHNLALTYEQQGLYEDAIKAYREAQAIAPWQSYPSYSLGLLLQKLNRTDDARAEFKRAIRVAEELKRHDKTLPYRWANLADGYNALATLEANGGSRRQARAYLAKASSIEPDNILVQHNQALLDARNPRTRDQAIKTWRKLLGYGPNLTFSLSLASALTSAGRDQEAALEYEAMVSAQPDNYDLRRRLVLAYVRAGAFQKAQTTVADGLRLTPNDSRLTLDRTETDAIARHDIPRTKDYREAVESARRNHVRQ